MKSYVRNILAVGLSAIVVAGAIVRQKQAMPLPAAPKAVETTGNDASKNIVNVQYWRDRDGWGDRRGWYRGHRGYGITVRVIVTTTVTGSRLQPLQRAPSLAALFRSRARYIARCQNTVRVRCIANIARSVAAVSIRRTSTGAMAATGPTMPIATRSSPIMAHARPAIRLTADRLANQN